MNETILRIKKQYPKALVICFVETDVCAAYGRDAEIISALCSNVFTIADEPVSVTFSSCMLDDVIATLADNRYQVGVLDEVNP